MLGAIIGDIVGSPYEFDENNIKTTEFPLFSGASHFTDDTVMTLAMAEGLMNGCASESAAEAHIAAAMKKYGSLYPNAGYGANFSSWLRSDDTKPYNSFGNGSAMRVSPVAWVFDDLLTVERYAAACARVTHNHPEGIKGAQATAAAIFLARKNAMKDTIRDYIESKYGYNLRRTLDEIRPGYRHVESCQETVPEAIIAFLESNGFEDAIRKAVSLGGDSDTLAAITGSIAEGAYGVPDEMKKHVFSRLDGDLLSVLARWNEWMISGHDTKFPAEPNPDRPLYEFLFPFIDYFEQRPKLEWDKDPCPKSGFMLPSSRFSEEIHQFLKVFYECNAADRGTGILELNPHYAMRSKDIRLLLVMLTHCISKDPLVDRFFDVSVADILKRMRELHESGVRCFSIRRSREKALTMNLHLQKLLEHLEALGEEEAARELTEYRENDKLKTVESMLNKESYYSPRELDQAQKQLEKLASKGNRCAMQFLGNMYYTGRLGYDQDYAKAREWYEKSASLNDHWALCYLGYVHYYGRGVEIDYEKAFSLFARSAYKGNYTAMYKMGDHYYYGYFVKRDYHSAFYWYQRALETAEVAVNYSSESDSPEIPNVLYRLGLCFAKGHGVEKDLILSLRYLGKAEPMFYHKILAEDDLFAEETLQKTQKLLKTVRNQLNALVEEKDDFVY